VLAVSAIAMMGATASYLRIVHGWDRLAALLGASPGSMAQVMVLAAEYGADVRAIAIVQTTRVVLLTVGLPLGLALFGLTLSPTAPAKTGSELGELALLVTVAGVAAVAMLWVRFPGGLLFGAMAGSGVLHGTGLVHATLPWWVTAASVITLGAVIGARFANTSPRALIGYLGPAFGSFAVSIAVAAASAAAVASFLPFRIADVVVAFAPGAQDTMMVLALALHLDPVYVGAHHLARFLIVTFTVAFAARNVGQPKRKPPDAGPGAQ
jgi:membrane AbrB-like protein